MAQIANISDDVLKIIFSMTSPPDICQMSLVCKRWHDLCKDDVVWGPMIEPQWRKHPTWKAYNHPILKMKTIFRIMYTERIPWDVFKSQLDLKQINLSGFDQFLDVCIRFARKWGWRLIPLWGPLCIAGVGLTAYGAFSARVASELCSSQLCAWAWKGCMGFSSTVYAYLGGFCFRSMAQFGLSPRQDKKKLLIDLKSGQENGISLGETLLTGANGLRKVSHNEILCYYIPVYNELIGAWLKAPAGSPEKRAARKSVSELSEKIYKRLEKLDS